MLLAVVCELSRLLQYLRTAGKKMRCYFLLCFSCFFFFSSWESFVESAVLSRHPETLSRSFCDVLLSCKLRLSVCMFSDLTCVFQLDTHPINQVTAAADSIKQLAFCVFPSSQLCQLLHRQWEVSYVSRICTFHIFCMFCFGELVFLTVKR